MLRACWALCRERRTPQLAAAAALHVPGRLVPQLAAQRRVLPLCRAAVGGAATAHPSRELAVEPAHLHGLAQQPLQLLAPPARAAAPGRQRPSALLQCSSPGCSPGCCSGCYSCTCPVSPAAPPRRGAGTSAVDCAAAAAQASPRCCRLCVESCQLACSTIHDTARAPRGGASLGASSAPQGSS
jgi:hypothetical protein